MVHDPDREDDNDENDGKGGKKNNKIPAGAFITPDIQKTDGLRNELQDRKNKKKENISPNIEVKKIRIENDEKSGEGEYKGGYKSDDTSC